MDVMCLSALCYKRISSQKSIRLDSLNSPLSYMWVPAKSPLLRIYQAQGIKSNFSQVSNIRIQWKSSQAILTTSAVDSSKGIDIRTMDDVITSVQPGIIPILYIQLSIYFIMSYFFVFSTTLYHNQRKRNDHKHGLEFENCIFYPIFIYFQMTLLRFPWFYQKWSNTVF